MYLSMYVCYVCMYVWCVCFVCMYVWYGMVRYGMVWYGCMYVCNVCM